MHEKIKNLENDMNKLKRTRRANKWLNEELNNKIIDLNKYCNK